jgi:DNA polymerase
MVHSRYLALPGDLDGTAKALKLTEGKDTAGKALIRYFSKPCKPTKKNGGATRNTPKSDPEKWAQFVEYNRQDVVVERAISRKLERWPVPVSEWKLWHLDQHINDRGVAVDRILVEQAIAMDSEHSSDVRDRMAEVTGLDNPNSVAQLKGWLADNGTEADSLAKDAVAGLIDDADGDVREALELRQALSRTSVKKYEAMASGMCSDGRVHGLLAFYGATRTGRWAGRLVQVQNLPRNYLHDLDLARNLVKAGDRESIELLFGDVPDVLSQLIRTALVPGVGRRFIISDFSAIEARVIAWVAGETWRMEVFATTGKIYEASASAMFHVPIESITKGDPLRQKGKVAELACIAEGELVLTDRGLVPIEQVTTEHLLWDGESWVTHKGVVYKGRREVITYEGLSATVDHLVWVEGESEPVHLGAAAACGAHLVRTADGRKTVSLGEGLPLIRAGSGAPEVLQDVYDILNAGKHNRFTVSGVLVHNCGYGGSVGALKNMGADKMGLSDAELKDIVRKWREASPHIVDLWWAVEEAAMIAIETQGEAKTHGVGFRYENGVLFVRLQSGRDLVYPSARIGIDEKFNTKCITYLGKDTGVWTRLHTYGPKIVENIIQALSRDCLAEAMLRLAGAGYKTVMHIHDEVVLEAPHGEGSLEEVNRIMGEPVSWAPGLLLGAAGFESDYYMKD